MTPQELIDQSNQLISERVTWDTIWQTIARLVLPMSDREFNRGVATSATIEKLEGWATGPKSVDTMNNRFDTTGLTALERLATGLVSLITPDNEKWQGLGILDSMGGPLEPGDGEKRWLDAQRDYLFNVRYNPASGWSEANKQALRSTCAFGTGLYMIEEAFGSRGQNDVRVPWRCSFLPLSENYLTVDAQNNLDQDFRRFRLTARQAGKMFGSQLSTRTLAKANDPKKWHQQVEFLHYIGYRQEIGSRFDPMRTSKVVSMYIEVDEKHLVRSGGFHYMPIIAYHWNQSPHSPYGESPVMLVLNEIRSANVHGKNMLLSSQQLTRPPVGTAEDGAMAKPNLNPGAINYGAIDAAGRPKIQPLLIAQSPGLIQEVLAASQNQIKEGLYVTLWQILVQNPNMTATEALIRANEKGELLGPMGSKIQAGLMALTEAELTILEGKGAWDQGSQLAPPDTLNETTPTPTFNSPLDRLRRSGEVLGIRQTLEIAGVMADMGKMEALDRIDADAVLDITQEVSGAPRKMFRKDEEVEAIRQARAQQQQAATAIAGVQAAGDAGQAAIPAIDMARKMAEGRDVNSNAA